MTDAARADLPRASISLKRRNGWVTGVAFSPDQNRLASASSDHAVKLWNTVTGVEILTLAGHQQEIASVAFSPDGKRLASGSDDGTMKLTCHRLGRMADALKFLEQSRQSLEQDRWKNDAESQGFLNEAETLIKSISPPIQ